MDNNTPPAPATSLPATCARRDCDHLAVASPELQCWAIGTPPEQRIEANAARYRLRLPICQLHAASSNVDDYCHDEGWRSIIQLHTAQGLAIPDRTTVRLAWVHLLPGDA
jgi:hypothetical protein